MSNLQPYYSPFTAIARAEIISLKPCHRDKAGCNNPVTNLPRWPVGSWAVVQVGSPRPRHWSEPCVITRQRRQEPEDRAGEMQFTRGGAVRHSPQISSRRADFPPL